LRKERGQPREKGSTHVAKAEKISNARLRTAGGIILAADDEGFPMRVEDGLLYVDSEVPMPGGMRHAVQGYLPEIKLVLSGTAAFVERRLTEIAKIPSMEAKPFPILAILPKMEKP
jgi:hypothetical protein